MKTNYVLMSEQEINLIKSRLKNDKDVDVNDFINKLDYYKNLNSKENTKKFAEYKASAVNKLVSYDSQSIENEDFIVDDDATVSVLKDGAYVSVWIWVENAVKPKRTRKKTV